MLINLGFPQRPACGDNMGGSGNSPYLKLNVKCSKSKQISSLKFEGIFYVNFVWSSNLVFQNRSLRTSSSGADSRDFFLSNLWGRFNKKLQLS